MSDIVPGSLEDLVRHNAVLINNAIGMKEDLRQTFRLLVNVLDLAEPVDCDSDEDAAEFVLHADNVAALRDLQQKLYFKYFQK